MKNWLIGKLGGVSKKDYEKVIWKAKEFESMATFYKERTADLLEENAGMKAEKAEMEKAAEMVSANLSETISRLNEERKVSNSLMAKMTAKTQKIEELQAEIEAKNAELADTKVKLLDVLRNQPSDPALRSEIARLKGELELLKRNKFKRGRK